MAQAKGRGYMECSSCGSKKLCTPRADGPSVLLREVVFEERRVVFMAGTKGAVAAEALIY